jgi:hypothetical protein
MEQNYQNHARIVPGYHYAAYAMAAIPFALSIYLLQMSTDSSNLFNYISLLSLSIFAQLILWYARVFALKAQDRAIRAEENLRHFVLTGKLLDNRLKLSQIVALRFAGDDEYLALIEKAITENLSNKNIKQLIKHWRADNNRV